MSVWDEGEKLLRNPATYAQLNEILSPILLPDVIYPVYVNNYDYRRIVTIYNFLIEIRFSPKRVSCVFPCLPREDTKIEKNKKQHKKIILFFCTHNKSLGKQRRYYEFIILL